MYHAHLLPEDWTDPADPTTNEINPRRPTLPVRATDFLSSLVKTDDDRLIFCGVLNGWPGLTYLELRSITCKVKSSLLGRSKIIRPWDSEKDEGTVPDLAAIFPEGSSGHDVRATLQMPPWSARWGSWQL